MEHIVSRIGQPARGGLAAGWTGRFPLPGGGFAPGEFDAVVDKFQKDHPFLSRAEAVRLVRQYGTRAGAAIGDARSREEMGQAFGAGLHEAEVRYLQEAEWAVSAEDIVFRRSKLGLRMRPDEIEALDHFLEETGAGAAARRA